MRLCRTLQDRCKRFLVFENTTTSQTDAADISLRCTAEVIDGDGGVNNNGLPQLGSIGVDSVVAGNCASPVMLCSPDGFDRRRYALLKNIVISMAPPWLGLASGPSGNTARC